jgi:hypothetical protein
LKPTCTIIYGKLKAQLFGPTNLQLFSSFINKKKMKKKMFKAIIYIFGLKNVTIMKKNTIFHFFKNTKKKKDRPKIYIIASDFFFSFFIF